jgi:hypothetical protein
MKKGLKSFEFVSAELKKKRLLAVMDPMILQKLIDERDKERKAHLSEIFAFRNFLNEKEEKFFEVLDKDEKSKALKFILLNNIVRDRLLSFFLRFYFFSDFFFFLYKNLFLSLRKNFILLKKNLVFNFLNINIIKESLRFFFIIRFLFIKNKYYFNKNKIIFIFKLKVEKKKFYNFFFFKFFYNLLNYKKGLLIKKLLKQFLKKKLIIYLKKFFFSGKTKKLLRQYIFALDEKK